MWHASWVRNIRHKSKINEKIQLYEKDDNLQRALPSKHTIGSIPLISVPWVLWPVQTARKELHVAGNQKRIRVRNSRFAILRSDCLLKRESPHIRLYIISLYIIARWTNVSNVLSLCAEIFFFFSFFWLPRLWCFSALLNATVAVLFYYKFYFISLMQRIVIK